MILLPPHELVANWLRRGRKVGVLRRGNERLREGFDNEKILKLYLSE